MTYFQEKEQSMEPDPQMDEMLKLSVKDLKIRMKNNLKGVIEKNKQFS